MKYLLTFFITGLLLISTTTFAATAKQTANQDLTPSLQALRQPQTTDFYLLTNKLGGYALELPKAFGNNPLAGLPHSDGPMQLRVHSETLLCAVNVLNPHDHTAFNPTAPLPELKNKEQLVQWKHGNTLVWNCTLSRQQDYNGDKLILKAAADDNSKTYELLYILPTKDYAILLPKALWSLNSFQVLQEK